MRKLPPSISEEEVRQLVQTASGGRFSWFSFVQGKTRCASIHSKLILMQNIPHVPMCQVFLHMARDGVQRGADGVHLAAQSHQYSQDAASRWHLSG